MEQKKQGLEFKSIWGYTVSAKPSGLLCHKGDPGSYHRDDKG